MPYGRHFPNVWKVGVNMTITLYNTSSANNELVKSLSGGTAKSGVVRGEINVVNPVVDVAGDITGYNYAMISDFGRYYYIKESRVVREGITRLYLRSDPLMSFSNSIKALQCIALRAEAASKQSPYIFDEKQKIQSYGKVQTISMGELPMSSLYVLVTAG